MKSLTVVLLPVAAVLAACTAMPTMNMIDTAARPEAVCAPAGTTQKMVAVGSGELTYECREKKDMADAFEWEVVSKYYVGPTWESVDGSKITGKQLAVAPARRAISRCNW